MLCYHFRANKAPRAEKYTLKTTFSRKTQHAVYKRDSSSVAAIIIAWPQIIWQ